MTDIISGSAEARPIDLANSGKLGACAAEEKLRP